MWKENQIKYDYKNFVESHVPHGCSFNYLKLKVGMIDKGKERTKKNHMNNTNRT